MNTLALAFITKWRILDKLGVDSRVKQFINVVIETDKRRGNPASAFSLKEALVVVSFSTLAGGVFVEVLSGMERTGRERCFRFDKAGNAEYAVLSELESNANAARWYGHAFKAKDFTFC